MAVCSFRHFKLTIIPYYRMIIISIYVNEQHNSAYIHEYLLQEKVMVKYRTQNLNIVLYDNSSDMFNIGHCVIQVKVTVGILNFLHLEQYKMLDPITK